MNKPRRKMIAVTNASQSTRLVFLVMDSGLVEKVEEFGMLFVVSSKEYLLLVDERYDFGKVLEYLRTYGEESE